MSMSASERSEGATGPEGYIGGNIGGRTITARFPPHYLSKLLCKPVRRQLFETRRKEVEILPQGQPRCTNSSLSSPSRSPFHP